MKELVFATVLAELKASWGKTIADPDLINLLYDAISMPVGLTNRKGDPITVSKGNVSKIMNRQTGGNAHRLIRSKSTDYRVAASIEEYFRINIVKRLLKGSEDDLIHRLCETINEDSNMSATKKQELLALAQKIRSPYFWQAYIYTLYQGIMFLPTVVVQSPLLLLQSLRSFLSLPELLV